MLFLESIGVSAYLNRTCVEVECSRTDSDNFVRFLRVSQNRGVSALRRARKREYERQQHHEPGASLPLRCRFV